MITQPTVLILGAGASCPYGYPDGKQLREKICSSFVNDSSAYLKRQGTTGAQERNIIHRAQQLTETFHKSSTKSIDLFLARNNEFMNIGKWSIIFRLLDAERNSTFREKMKNRNHDWYSYLFDKLTDDLVQKEDYSRFCENKISFITFNYDRSLEHFLYESLLNSFHKIESKKMVEQLSKLRIIHLFGQIAGLEWQEFESKILYRTEFTSVDIQRLADKLRIIYEEKENPELKEAQQLISEAQNIFFLGFGYSKENLGLLNIPGILKQKQQIRGTALGSTIKEGNDISSSITKRSGTMFLACDIQIHEDWDSLQLLRQYL